MKLLTIITTICAPPTVVAGIYGMNFNTQKSPFNMPELDWYFGYPYAITIMVLLVILTTFVLWKLGWLDKTEYSNHPN